MMIESHLRRREARTSEAQTIILKGNHFKFKTNCLFCFKEVKLKFLNNYPNDEKTIVYGIRKK